MSDLDTYARAGITALQEGKIDEAISCLGKALLIDGSRPDLNSMMGTAYLRRGEVGSALPYLEKAVLLAEPFEDPRHQDLKREFHQELAAAYAMLDRTIDAGRVLSGAIARWPDKVEPRLQLGQLEFQTGRVEAGLAVFRELTEHPSLDADRRQLAEVVVGAVRAFQEAGHDGSVFLRAHAESYKAYFDSVVAEPSQAGWYAEAARMARGADGEPKPIIPKDARPYAMQRVDLVNPTDGTVSSVYSEGEAMIVALNGLEPLAQFPILFPWPGNGFPVVVSTRCPWHWLTVTIQFVSADAPEALIDRVDATVGDWYLAGFNGEFGEKESGRFHFVTDPEVVGTRAVTYTFDLGRAAFSAIPALLTRLAVVNDRHAIWRVSFGEGRILA
jgi:tetratricopeptide (TPR) repeat protein